MRRAAAVLWWGILAASLLSVGRMAPLQAQGDGSCPALVRDGLDALHVNCQDAGRDTVCRGYSPLAADFWTLRGTPALGNPGATVPALDVRALAGSPLSLAKGTWGLGLLRLGADAPDALPDRHLTLLMFGQVMVENNVPPEEARPPVTPIALTATAGVNLRRGPGTNSPIVGSVPAGETVQAIGRNAAGDWFQVATDGGRAWVTAQFVRAAGDPSTLPVMTEGTPPGPLQSFAFQTGVGRPPCREAPPDHLLIHSPAGMPLTFTADGVTFTLVSATAALQAADGLLTATIFAGEAEVRVEGGCAGNCQATIPEGYAVDVPLSPDGRIAAGPPGNIRLLDPDRWIAYLDVWSRFPEGLAGVPAFDLWGLLAATGNLAWNDVEITLTWDGPADLDLTVIEPNGTVIYYGHPESGTGGRLAADANYPCGGSAEPRELVSWPTGRAPYSTYGVRIDQFDSCGAAATTWTPITARPVVTG